MPPIDSPLRDISDGGFPGSHTTHIPPGNSPPIACEKCHPGSSSYNSGHRNGFINLTSNINNSPHPAKAVYNKAVFFNQTSRPDLRTCSNVNCHFENTTPTWGASPAETGCSTCHGSPPGDGSHPRHAAFACLKCHPDHTAEAQSFSHATSVGKRPLALQFVVAPNTGGAYSGDLSYPNYLPSQSRGRNGSCQNLYCHSDGKGGTPNVQPVWSTPLPTDCSGCHGTSSSHGAPDYANAGGNRANSHARHARSSADCEKCHIETTATGTAIKDGSLLHGNGSIDVTFDPGIAGPSANYNGNSKTCTAVYCHSDGTSVATGIPASVGGGMVWGATSGICNMCHDYPPSYPNGTPKANTHAKHNFCCSTCHAATTVDNVTVSDTAHHGNHAYDVVPGPGISFTYVFAATGGTCSAISCHNNGTAVWGSTLTCGSCHSTSPGGD